MITFTPASIIRRDSLPINFSFRIYQIVLAAIFLLSAITQKANATGVVPIGTAATTTTISGPSSTTSSGARNERHMCIYSAAELTAAGLSNGSVLLGIGWEKTGTASYVGNDLTIRIWLKYSAATTFPANPTFTTETSSATLVYETFTGSIPAATGWLDFIFNTANPSFTWNGTGHIQVITEIIRPTDWTTTGFSWRTIATLTNAAANANAAAATPPATLTRTGTRPQIRFTTPTVGDDAALLSMTSPVSAPPGVQNINVLLKNYGSTTLTSATIGWSINGGATTNYNWTGSLAPGGFETVTIASPNLAFGQQNVTATVTSPNGNSDAAPSNNTASTSVLICNPLSGNYTINSGAATGGTNFNSFTDLSYYLSNCGVGGHTVVTVAPGSGPYLEQVAFQNISGLGPNATVTIDGNGETITKGDSIALANTKAYIVRLRNVSYFTVKNLVIEGPNLSQRYIGLQMFAPCTNINVYNNTFNGPFLSASSGPVTSVLIGAIVGNGDNTSFTTGGAGFSDIRIAKNTVNGGGKGINFYGVTGGLAANLLIDSNTVSSTGADCIFVSAAASPIIRDNIVNIRTGTGITVYQNNTNALVYSNEVSSTSLPTITSTITGIHNSGSTTTNTKIYNNLIWKMNSPGANIAALETQSSTTNTQFYYNTVILDDATATGAFTAGYNEGGSNSLTVLRDNIFYITRPSTSWVAGIAVGSGTTVATGITSNNNIFWVPSGNVAVKKQITTANPPGTLYPTLASWQTASTEDANSYSANPVFVSPTTNPTPTNFVIDNIGSPIAGITQDKVYATRNVTAPDAGALEFTGLCNPVGGTVSPVTSVVCSGTSKTFTVTGQIGNTQWQTSTNNVVWIDVPGATTSTYILPNITQTTYVRALAKSNTCYNISSTSATVSVSQTPVITFTNITSSTATISWTPYGANQYTVSWSGAGTGSQTNATNPFTIPGLSASTNLSVTVTQATPTCAGTVAGTASTTTLCAKPTVSTVTAVTSPTGVKGLRVQWTAVAGATAYRVYYRPLILNANWSSVDTAGGTVKTIKPLYASVPYAVMVAAYNCPTVGQLGQPSDVHYFTYTAPGPPPCAPVPTITAVSNCPNQLTVNLIGGTGVWRVTARRLAPTFSAGVSYTVSSPIMNLTVTATPTGSTWEVFAQAVCGSNYSGLSNVQVVSVKAPCEAPQNVVLSNPFCTGFTASWNAANCNGVTLANYQIYLKKTTAVNFISYNAGTLDHNTINSLSTGTYQVFIRAIACNGSYSPASQLDTIIVGGPGCRADEAIVENEITKTNVAIYPNPTDNWFTVDVTAADKSGELRIDVIDALGRVVYTDISATEAHIPTSRVVNLPSYLNSGVYFVRMQIGEQVFTQRLMVQHD